MIKRVQDCVAEGNQESNGSKWVKRKGERSADNQEKMRNESGCLANETQISGIMPKQANHLSHYKKNGSKFDFDFQ